jgi:hypothetical protein
MPRVTPEQAAVFAGYHTDDSPVWYQADPSLLKQRGDDAVEFPYDKERDEFIWLRDLALDLLDERQAHAETQAAYAEAVRTLKEVQNRHWDEFRTELVKNALSTPRAVAALREIR